MEVIRNDVSYSKKNFCVTLAPGSYNFDLAIKIENRNSYIIIFDELSNFFLFNQ